MRMGSEDEHQVQGCLNMEIEHCRSQDRGRSIAAGYLTCGDGPSEHLEATPETNNIWNGQGET
jgi:hypothetical protein